MAEELSVRGVDVKIRGPWIVFLPVELVYGQIELNKLWQRERVARAG